MNPKVRRITETAVMTALLVALQAATASLGNQFVTGSCVNAVLALTILLVGLWSGAAAAALSPFFAFLLGIGPQLLPIVPAIAAGNLVGAWQAEGCSGRAAGPCVAGGRCG